MSLNLPDQAFFFFYHVSQTKRDEGHLIAGYISLIT